MYLCLRAPYVDVMYMNSVTIFLSCFRFISSWMVWSGCFWFWLSRRLACILLGTFLHLVNRLSFLYLVMDSPLHVLANILPGSCIIVSDI